LSYKALRIALWLLKIGGYFLCKVFEGDGFVEFKQEASSYFEDLRLIRPTSTRKRSREIFLVGFGLKNNLKR
jgi:23S rRNA (uridine2552-2'-O)-methyltransferase